MNEVLNYFYDRDADVIYLSAGLPPLERQLNGILISLFACILRLAS